MYDFHIRSDANVFGESALKVRSQAMTGHILHIMVSSEEPSVAASPGLRSVGCGSVAECFPTILLQLVPGVLAHGVRPCWQD